MVGALRDALRSHAPGAQNDDISYAVISPMVRGTSHMADSLEERLVWRLDAENLRDEATLPRMFEDIARAQWTVRFNGELQTVLAELYANSLDYGVLGLSSLSKRNLATYGDYMMARASALDALVEGNITIQLSLGSDGQSLVLEIEDSGPGFVPPAEDHIGDALVAIDPASPPSGRGIAMVQAIASEVSYTKEGRAVRVVLREAPQIRLAPAPTDTVEPKHTALAVAFEAVMSTARRAILIEDADRNIVAVNHLFCELFRLQETPRQLVGRDCVNTLLTQMPNLAEPDAFVLRVGELVEGRAPALHDEILFADGTVCHRDYHPVSGGLHLWSYRSTAEIGLLMPDQVDSRDDAIDIDLRSRLELALHGLERAHDKDPSDLVASVGFAAAHDGHRLVQLMETMRTVWRQGHYEASTTTEDVNDIATLLANDLLESGVAVELTVRAAGHLSTWPRTIEGIINALVGGGCYARCAVDGGRVAAQIDFTGGGIALGSVKAPRHWSNEEGETMRRVRSTVASLLAVRVGGGLEHEVDDGMDTWMFWVPATGVTSVEDDAEHHVGAAS
jgi:PAS domain-containing protein